MKVDIYVDGVGSTTVEVDSPDSVRNGYKIKRATHPLYLRLWQMRCEGGVCREVRIDVSGARDTSIMRLSEPIINFYKYVQMAIRWRSNVRVVYSP